MVTQTKSLNKNPGLLLPALHSLHLELPLLPLHLQEARGFLGGGGRGALPEQVLAAEEVPFYPCRSALVLVPLGYPARFLEPGVPGDLCGLSGCLAE